MVEHIVPVTSLPEVNSTLVSTGVAQALGGSALNVAWYLACLGRPVRVVAPVGAADKHLLATYRGNPLLDTSGVLFTRGRSDLLVSAVSKRGHLSFYLLSDLSSVVPSAVYKRSVGADVLVLSGSRHPELRSVFQRLALHRSRSITAFNPSYAIYEYTPRQLADICTGSSVIIVNSDERTYLLDAIGRQAYTALWSSSGRQLIVTRGPRGATLHTGGRSHLLSTPIRKRGNFLGAGDGVIAGYVHMYSHSGDPVGALRFALAVAAGVVQADRIRARLSASDIQRWLR